MAGYVGNSLVFLRRAFSQFQCIDYPMHFSTCVSSHHDLEYGGESGRLRSESTVAEVVVKSHSRMAFISSICGLFAQVIRLKNPSLHFPVQWHPPNQWKLVYPI